MLLRKKKIKDTWYLLDENGEIIKGGFPNEKTIDRYIFFLDSLPTENELKKRKLIEALEKECSSINGSNNTNETASS